MLVIDVRLAPAGGGRVEDLYRVEIWNVDERTDALADMAYRITRIDGGDRWNGTIKAWPRRREAIELLAEVLRHAGLNEGSRVLTR